jgi:hypothetical protein
MITLRWSADAAGSKVWTVYEANGAYAQVAVAGRSFDQIQGDQDVNRPFNVVGAIVDNELLSIVNFVRSSNPGPLRGVRRDGPDAVAVMFA